VTGPVLVAILRLVQPYHLCHQTIHRYRLFMEQVR